MIERIDIRRAMEIVHNPVEKRAKSNRRRPLDL
jgi:hypothetical protein